jgi:hypothetical protein
VYGKITSSSPQAAGEASVIDYAYELNEKRVSKYLNNYSAPFEHH